jgi:hypothetical protein
LSCHLCGAHGVQVGVARQLQVERFEPSRRLQQQAGSSIAFTKRDKRDVAAQ